MGRPSPVRSTEPWFVAPCRGRSPAPAAHPPRAAIGFSTGPLSSCAGSPPRELAKPSLNLLRHKRNHATLATNRVHNQMRRESPDQIPFCEPASIAVAWVNPPHPLARFAARSELAPVAPSFEQAAVLGVPIA